MGLGDRARAAHRQLSLLAAAMTDERTPWYAKAVAGLTIGLAASPIDPIPDFVPVLGSLDDLVFVPVGVWFARAAVPDTVLADAELQVQERRSAGVYRWLVALVVILGWVAVGAAAGWLLWPYVPWDRLPV